jgi:hypothetical protein
MRQNTPVMTFFAAKVRSAHLSQPTVQETVIHGVRVGVTGRVLVMSLIIY